MTNLFGSSNAKHEHAAGGCGCASHHADTSVAEDAVHTHEGCCSGHDAKAADHLAVEAKDDVSEHAHGSCCGGHAATPPARKRVVRDGVR